MSYGVAVEPGHLVLIAEDDAASRALVAIALAHAGYEVREAADGRTAWEFFERESGAERFGVVITDVMMPGLNGLELAERIRSISLDVPIVLLTALDDKETIKKALRLGVNEFIEKPLDRVYLLQQVAKLIAERPDPGERARQRETAEAVRRTHSLLLERDHDCPFEVCCEPLKDAGGDVFRCAWCEDGSHLFVMADVAGHSVASSYAVASFLGAFAAHSLETDDLSGLLRELNKEVQLGPFADVPICVMAGRWWPATGRLHLANAGLPNPCHFRRRRGLTERIRLNGTPLGLLPEGVVEDRVVVLEEADRVLLGSDGLFEALSAANVPFEEEVDRHWRDLRRVSVKEALLSLDRAVRLWSNGVLADDLLVVGFEQPCKRPCPEELFVELGSTFAQVDFACGQLETFLGSDAIGRPLTERQVFDVVQAARETLLNSVVHGNRGNPEALVTLCCGEMVDPGLLLVTVTDEGEGFDLNPALPSDRELADGRRGLLLMNAFADRVAAVPGETQLVFDLERKEEQGGR